MKYSESIKPISYFKSHMAQILRTIKETQEPMIITQNGEAEAVVLDIHHFERMQETLAMLELIAQGRKELAEGKYQPAGKVFAEILADET